MRLVIDSNRFMAGLLKDSKSRQVILSERFEFYSPDYLIVEIENHKDYLVQKSGLGSGEFDLIAHILMENLRLVCYEEFRKKLEPAIEIMKDIDINDAPFLAVGLALGLDGIWTEDSHFREQGRLRVYTTRDLLGMLKRRGPE